MNETTHEEYMRVSFAFAFGFSVAAVPVSVLAAWLTYLLVGSTSAALTVLVGALLVAGLIVTGVLIMSLRSSQAMLTDYFSDWLDERETRRAALTEGKVAIQETHVDARGVGNAIAVNNAPVESVRLVPVRGSGSLIDGVPIEDLREFVERITLIGHSQRAWMGKTLASGRTISTFEEYRALVQPLVKAGLIVNRGERSSGQLVIKDVEEIKRTLGL